MQKRYLVSMADCLSLVKKVATPLHIHSNSSNVMFFCNSWIAYSYNISLVELHYFCPPGCVSALAFSIFHTRTIIEQAGACTHTHQNLEEFRNTLSCTWVTNNFVCVAEDICIS